MLELKLIQQTLLLDSDSLNTGTTSISSTCFDDPNTITESNFDDYDSGRKTKLDNLEVLTLEPHFFIKFLFIESRLPFDCELFQPELDRTGETPVGPLIAATSFLHRDISRLFIQFGIYEKILITSRGADNPIKYLMLGTETI